MRIKKHIISLLSITLILTGCAYHADLLRVPDTPLYNRALVFNNVQYVPLIGFCDYYSLDWDWDFASQKITVKKGQNSVILRPNSNLAIVNDRPFTLNYPVEYKKGAAYIPTKTAIFLSEDVFGIKKQPPPPPPAHQIKTVVIDPGHGGKDSGAVSRTRYRTKEKDVVLDISRRLKRHLEKKGFRVLLTRKRDVFIPLRKRAEFANKNKADLFVSIHANASRYRGARGFEVYYLSEATDDTARALEAAENASLKFEEGLNSVSNPTAYDLVLSENRRESKEVAYFICNVTADRLRMKKRGVKGARFVVLKGAMMPAVLVEVGFLSNTGEESRLKKPHFRERIADAISRSILAYKKEYERTNGFSK